MEKGTNKVKLIIGAISIFGLGYALAFLIDLPPLPVICFCLAFQVAVLLLHDKTVKGKK
jgi:hypothetical protein